jgi:uncharacterized protein
MTLWTRDTMTRLTASAFALALMLTPTLAAAQFSESYNFLKAVRDRDGAKATEIVSKPGTVIIDTRDRATGEGALHIVTRGRDTSWLTFLLSRGAKADIRDNKGETPLMIAAQLGFVEGAQTLIKFRANPNQPNNSGETPLHRAVQQRDAAMVRFLMQNGANPNRADTLAGLTARDYAVRDNRAAAILKIIDETKPTKPAGPVAGPK